jgi:hypothetical protein
MSSNEIYVSTDVETDGPIPRRQIGGPNSPRPGRPAGKNSKRLKRPCAATSCGSKPFPESQYSSATLPDSISYSFTGT